MAAIAAASLHPLQIVEPKDILERVKTEPELKPDKDWDGSVISLMNYPGEHQDDEHCPLSDKLRLLAA